MVILGSLSQQRAQPSRWWLAVAALLIVWWFAMQWQQHRPGLATIAAPVSGAATRTYLNRSEYLPRVFPAALTWFGSSAGWSAQLRDADDLMAFVDRARLDPASGGYYYALKAFDFCNREAKVAGRVPPLDDLFAGGVVPVDVRQVSAWMRITALCRQFAVLPAGMSYLALAEEGIELGDPKLALALRMERLSAAPFDSPEMHDAQLRIDLLTRIFASRDPALMRDLAQELQIMQPAVTFALNDAPLSAEESDRLIDALLYIACSWGGTCGRIDDRAALLSCAHQGVCVPTPFAVEADARLVRMAEYLLASGGTALQFGSPRPAPVPLPVRPTPVS